MEKEKAEIASLVEKYGRVQSLMKYVNSDTLKESYRKQPKGKAVGTDGITKEEYYYRSIFEEYFPSESAALSVPSVPSVACSTAEALAWDASFQGKNDPSGRAVAGVHEEAYEQ